MSNIFLYFLYTSAHLTRKACSLRVDISIELIITCEGVKISWVTLGNDIMSHKAVHAKHPVLLLDGELCVSMHGKVHSLLMHFFIPRGVLAKGENGCTLQSPCSRHGMIQTW